MNSYDYGTPDACDYYSRMAELEQEQTGTDCDDDGTHCPSSTAGDYSPSDPWNAPGMGIRDFI